jgi:predicted HTH domain antitoxin
MPVILSDEELQAFHLTESEARLALALRLFQDDRVTVARGAKIAGMKYLDFQSELAKRQIPLHYDMEMLENDLKYAGYTLK